MGPTQPSQPASSFSRSSPEVPKNKEVVCIEGRNYTLLIEEAQIAKVIGIHQGIEPSMPLNKNKLASLDCEQIKKSNLPSVDKIGAATLLEINTEDVLTSKLENYLEGAVKAWPFSGSVAIVKEGKVLVNQGYGQANETQKNTPQTKFNVASVTKPFTAVAILKLQQEGHLKAQDPINMHLPPHLRNSKWEEITIEQLLNHTSGIPDYAQAFPMTGDGTKIYSFEDLLNAFKDKELRFNPGEKQSYSNSGYALLGAIIEHETGQSYGNYMKSIFESMGMPSTGYGGDTNAPSITEKAIGHRVVKDEETKKDKTVEERGLHPSQLYAAGGLYTTVEDLIVWNEVLNSDQFLPREVLDTALIPCKKLDERTQKTSLYGYGWNIENEEEGHQKIYHSGEAGGIRSMFIRFPKEKACVVVLSNNQDSNAIRVAEGLSEILFDQPVSPPEKLSSKDLKEFVNVYEEGDKRYCILENEGKLYWKDLETKKHHVLYPESRSVLYFDYDAATTLTFNKETGKVVLHESGKPEKNLNTLNKQEAAQVLQTHYPAAVTVDLEKMQKLAGIYQSNGQIIEHVKYEEGHLFCEHGVERYEIIPLGENHFHCKIFSQEYKFVEKNQTYQLEVYADDPRKTEPLITFVKI